MLGLIRRYLEAGILANGVVMERHEGTPQGGPLSPLLANVLLDEVDKELEKRGHAFVRYADDCNVYVRSQASGRAGDGGAASALRAAPSSASTSRRARWRVPRNRKFLGYSFWVAPGRKVKRRVAPQALEAMKERVRELTRRVVGRSIAPGVQGTAGYLGGLEGLLPPRGDAGVFADLDEWIRHRLRALQLKHWKRGRRSTASCELAG